MRGVAMLAAVVAGLFAAAVVWTRGAGATPAVSPGQPLDPPAAPMALVFVSGAVQHPGLYRLSADARGTDAVAMAGGLGADADLGRLPNLAARVHDGRQLNVPSRGGRTAASAASKMDINTATVEELRVIPGMPAGAAEAIVAYRQQWGAFGAMSELRTALGLDAATVALLGKSLRVPPPSAG